MMISSLLIFQAIRSVAKTSGPSWVSRTAAHKDLLTVLVPQPVSPTNVDAALLQSQIEAAKRGCNLVLVHRSGIRNSHQAGGWLASDPVPTSNRNLSRIGRINHVSGDSGKCVSPNTVEGARGR